MTMKTCINFNGAWVTEHEIFITRRFVPPERNHAVSQISALAAQAACAHAAWVSHWCCTVLVCRGCLAESQGVRVPHGWQPLQQPLGSSSDASAEGKQSKTWFLWHKQCVFWSLYGLLHMKSSETCLLHDLICLENLIWFSRYVVFNYSG